MRQASVYLLKGLANFLSEIYEALWETFQDSQHLHFTLSVVHILKETWQLSFSFGNQRTEPCTELSPKRVASRRTVNEGTHCSAGSAVPITQYTVGEAPIWAEPGHNQAAAPCSWAVLPDLRIPKDDSILCPGLIIVKDRLKKPEQSTTWIAWMDITRPL